MKTKLTFLVFVTLALVLLVSPVLAAGAGESRTLVQQTRTYPKTHIISFTGKITSFTADGFYVYVQMTNNPYIARRGTSERVKVDSSTLYYEWISSSKRVVCHLGDLKLGDKVSINAVATTAVTTAKRVEVNKPRY